MMADEKQNTGNITSRVLPMLSSVYKQGVQFLLWLGIRLGLLDESDLGNTALARKRIGAFVRRIPSTVSSSSRKGMQFLVWLGGNLGIIDKLLIRTPTAPKCALVNGNKIAILWTTEIRKGKPAYYEIRQTQINPNSEWAASTFDENEITIQATLQNLKSDSRYKFQVRAVYDDGEVSPYSESSLVMSTEPPAPLAPRCSSIHGNKITILWTVPSQAREPTYYEVWQTQGTHSEWTVCTYKEKGNRKCAVIQNLKYSTPYMFKVRAVYQDGHMGPFSEISDTFTTENSAATNILPLCTLITSKDVHPRQYSLPVFEFQRDPDSKTRKCVVATGEPSSTDVEEKVILMVGELGAGKSTFIDGLVNYLFGVTWDDDFRYRLAGANKSDSQTEWITSYTVYTERSDIPQLILTIIDTPGFDDSKLPDENEKLNSRIRKFFPELQEHGKGTIDAVCFVTKSQVATNHEYIFDSILSTFGKNVKDNIVVMATFADQNEPPVKEVLKRANVPYTKMFKCNNAALFDNGATNKDNSQKDIWNMSAYNFGLFIAHLLELPRRSLKLTSFVLDTRNKLATIIAGLRPLIALGLEDMQTIQKDKKLVNEFEQQILQNKDFTYKEKRIDHKHIPIEDGTFVTNCLVCDYTCHYPCKIPENENKARCTAMRNEVCTVCPGKCHWQQHRNNGYRVKLTQVETEKTNEDMKVKYDLARGEKLTMLKIIQKMEEEYKIKRQQVYVLLEKVRECNNFLAENALRAAPLSSVESIKLIIAGEEKEKKPGYAERIKLLEEFKRDAEMIDSGNIPLPVVC